MSEDRREQVLQAIVKDYVYTGEPVGSRGIVERHQLPVSPATIRNDMSVLEEAGYITQPHTSAGRIPTDKGYRAFVDQIAKLKPLSSPERTAIERILTDAVDLDDVVSRTVQLLVQLTNNVAVVQYPTLRRAVLRHLELVAMTETRVLMVVITETGRVEQVTVEADQPVDDAILFDLRTRLNIAAQGQRSDQIATALQELPKEIAPEHRPLAGALVAALARVVGEETEERMVLGGTANLLRSHGDFQYSIGPVLEALEEQVVLLKLFTEMDTDDLTVSIGAENHHESLQEASIVTGAYGPEGEILARVGVLGPTRMDYPNAMSSVRAVARYLSGFLAN